MGLILSFCSKSRLQTLERNEQAIIDCKICRDKIKSYIRTLEKQERIKKEQAKLELKDGNRDKAKRLLNKSKIFSEQIKVANGQLDMIMDQITQIESAQMKKDALQVLEQGNIVLRKLNEEVNIEKWEKISDEMNEIKQQQEEISEYLTNHRIDQDKFNEDLNKELEELENIQKQSENMNDIVELTEKKKIGENSIENLREINQEMQSTNNMIIEN